MVIGSHLIRDDGFSAEEYEEIISKVTAKDINADVQLRPTHIA